jgi:murein L,D-transpeptidase YafK
MAFWRMLKQGHDHFEVTHLEPRIDVCEKRYVFDAETIERFSPADRCPFYRIPEEIAASVAEKQRRDEIETAELINRGISAAPVATGLDGGTHPAYAAAR